MYLSYKAVNWVCTASFTVFAVIGFYFRFLVLLLLLLLYYIHLYSSLPLVFYSTSLFFLSFYTMHVSCVISFTISLPAPVCLCSRHDFQCMLFWFEFIDIHVLIPAWHLAFAIPFIWMFLSSLDPHVQISELELVDSSGCWLEMRRRIMDHRQAFEALSLQAPCLALEFPFYGSWEPFVLFILVYLFVFS